MGDPLHLLFDVLAYLVAALTLWLCRRQYARARSPIPEGFGLFYLVVASAGAIVGSFALGTANTALAGMDGALAKSVLGAILGGIAAIELMKWRYRLKGSTGALLVPGIALGIAVGRLGCFFSGLGDYTYGIATELPIGVDFGDGISRHPVQLYEAGALLGFFVLYLYFLSRRTPAAMAWGFYLFCGFYGVQRLLWETLKPYPSAALGLNVFQLGCLVLIVYAAVQYRLAQFNLTRSPYESA